VSWLLHFMELRTIDSSNTIDRQDLLTNAVSKRLCSDHIATSNRPKTWSGHSA